ncbi:hypothetical protein AT727_05555 [Desulfitobacterium hafniense]|uniref:Uncharacterized protein n=3 Tax=Desulfitobacterium hafniense TaxID=49338 RepID=Q24X18_DESHY|nr:hypothetical protein AT727_05555 [Desulfitobacterium hafniense]BAE83424.1 hypothetical protein DSY1635 [Desulfitobacterium hafniense Y51]
MYCFMVQDNKLGRERLSSLIIIFCLFLTVLTSIGVNYLDVKVLNIELIDRELYTVITEKGNVNIHPDDVLRIERTYTKEAFTGESVELDKIYTDKGFVYLSSQAPYAELGQKLMNTVDYYGFPLWERSGVDWNSLTKYSYAVGTPAQQVPLLFFLLSLQYAALTIGGIALIVLVFPLRLGEEEWESSSAFAQGEEESNQEEQDELRQEVMKSLAK